MNHEGVFFQIIKKNHSLCYNAVKLGFSFDNQTKKEIFFNLLCRVVFMKSFQSGYKVRKLSSPDQRNTGPYPFGTFTSGNQQ